MSGNGSSSAWSQLLPRDVADVVARVIVTMRAHKAVLMEGLRILAASSLGEDPPLDVRLVPEIYMPTLRGAAESLARGDFGGFVDCSRHLGAQLADAAIPFAATVAHLSFLKRTCAVVLAGYAGETGEAIFVLDKLMACLISAAAESYYARTRSGPLGPPMDGAPAGPTMPSFESAGFFHGMVGRSPEMQRVFAGIPRIASSGAPTLIVGETGTGKELVARAVHLAGPRRNGPFVAVNCAALPRELIESELFGYKRGAFSGAVGESPGLFRTAAGGTLLLDEITEMSPALQAKLLRVLQERTVRPLGAMTEEPIDVHIVASTNRDPDEALREGMLRADLYYRLAVARIPIPPLRERRVDIPPLVEYRLAALNAHPTRKRVHGVTEAALEALMAEPWPGNVRQLFNVVENAATMGATVIGVDDLELSSGRRAAAVAPAPEPGSTFRESERAVIERTLAFTGGNKVRAAQLLGISRKKLYARLARYGLSS